MTIYKILPQDVVDAAIATGSFNGSPLDLSDGFIHFSTAAQVHETAAKHFSGVPDLLLVAVSRSFARRVAQVGTVARRRFVPASVWVLAGRGRVVGQATADRPSRAPSVPGAVVRSHLRGHTTCRSFSGLLEGLLAANRTIRSGKARISIGMEIDAGHSCPHHVQCSDSGAQVARCRSRCCSRPALPRSRWRGSRHPRPTRLSG